MRRKKLADIYARGRHFIGRARTAFYRARMSSRCIHLPTSARNEITGEIENEMTREYRGSLKNIRLSFMRTRRRKEADEGTSAGIPSLILFSRFTEGTISRVRFGSYPPFGSYPIRSIRGLNVLSRERFFYKLTDITRDKYPFMNKKECQCKKNVKGFRSTLENRRSDDVWYFFVNRVIALYFLF